MHALQTFQNPGRPYMLLRDSRVLVLVVENSRVLARRIVEWLEADERVIVVSVADNASRAIDEHRRLKPDVVVLDIALGGHSNGYDVLRAISIEPESTRPDVIVFTNHSSRPYRDAARRLGVVHFFDKSGDFMRMVQEMGRLAQRRLSRNGSEG